ncbi:MAG: RHS repeat-associated core domain-containing protein [candidate division Zixibacteria bacterium]|nr:RHS repeat-associated core domain-containing protein [candidate division Zixibacteria bacterium]
MNIAATVDLFSGQHKEVIPLVSIPGRNGMGVSVSLSYNGAVAANIHKPNNVSQASTIGMGFSIPTEAVVAVTFNTVSLEDDKYYYNFGSGATELIPLEDNQYTTNTGSPWIITRSTGTIDGTSVVTGWQIIKDNGLIYKFGDFDDGTLRNATRYQLRWWNSFSPGASAYPSLYPTQWDLQKVQDTENLNAIDYSYDQTTKSVRVYTGYSSQLSSTQYTSESNISTISCPGGAAIRFAYSVREDCFEYYPDSRPQYYSTHKLDSINVSGPSDDDVSGVRFSYSFLNPSGGATYKKLLLSDIYKTSILGDSELDPTHFDYYTSISDVNYGAISAITNPFDGEMQVHYKEIEADSNFADLSVKLSEQMERYQISVAGNSFILDRAPSSGISANKDLYGTWNGFWDWDIDTHTATSKKDYPVVSPDGWIAKFDRTNNRIVVKRWMNGYWKLEIISVSWTPVGERVRLFAGNDYIMAYDMDPHILNDERDGWQTRHCYMYKWDGEQWIANVLYEQNGLHDVNGDPMFILNYSCSPDMPFIHFGRNYSTETITKSVIGKYLHDTQGISFASGLESSLLQFDGRARATQTSEYCAWPIENEYFSPSYIYTSLGIADWSGSAWLHPDPVDTFIRHGGGWVDSVTAPLGRVLTDNAIFWERYKMDYTVTPYWKKAYAFSAIRGANGWVRTPARYVGDDYSGSEFYETMMSSQNLVITRHYNSLQIWQWTGTSQWVVTDFGSVPDESEIRVLDNLIVTMSPQGVLKAKRLINNTTWSATTTLLSEAYVGNDDEDVDDPADGYPNSMAFTVQDNYILAMDNSNKHAMLYTWENGAWVTNDLSSVMDTPGSTQHFLAFSTPSSFYIAQKLSSETKHYCFRKYGTQFSGKAAYPVVDYLLSYETQYDTAPVRVNFSYFGGILDESTSIPRFARSTVSLPFTTESSPEGYEVHCYYNDVDDNTFSVSGIPGFTFPDLENSITYGLQDGGYFLDGLEYLNYTFTTGDNASVCNDTTRNYYSVYQPPNYPDCVYRVQLDSVHTRQDLIANDVKYLHENDKGRLVSTRTKYKFNNSFMVDSIVYAADLPAYSGLADDNAITLVAKRINFLDNDGVATVLNKDGVDFALNGTWGAIQSYTWEDQDTETGKVIIQEVLPNGESFNEFGSMVSSVNGEGDSSCVKLGKDGLMIVARAVNCYPNDFLVQDFEQGYGWDSWVMLDDYHHQIIDDDAFTGKYCFRVRDNSGSNDYNWGPKRNFSADSLTDTRYYFSGWVKATDTIVVFCFGWDMYDNPISIPNNSIKFTEVSSTEWTRVEGVFDISSVAYLLDDFQFRVAMTDVLDAWAYFDDFRFHPLDAAINTTVFDPVTGRSVAIAGTDNLPIISKSDTFGRDSVTYNHRGNVLSRTEYSTVLTSAGLNWNKSIKFRSDVDSTTSVTFSDGLGQIVQTRIQESEDGSGSVIVGDTRQIDARGRVIRNYLPFVDQIAPNGLMDYSNEIQAHAEATQYYSASGPGADCGQYPYAELAYSKEYNSRVDSAANPGNDWSLSSERVKRFGHRVDVGQELIVDSTIDADNVIAENRFNRWGDFSQAVVHYSVNSTPRTSIRTSYADLRGRDTLIVIDTLSSTSAVEIQKNYFNQLDYTDSTWNRDYGTIRILYDRNGSVRFTQNDKQLVNNEFTYMKYDRNGRGTEEGVMGSADVYFTKARAENRYFPQSSHNPIVKFKFTFDYFVTSMNDTLLAPGRLVRVENGNSTYYREFIRFPANDSDLVITKLPNLYYRKAVGHSYNIRGDIVSNTFYPRYPSTTGKRKTELNYDQMGRLYELSNGDITGSSRQVYAQYLYNAASNPTTINFGLHKKYVSPGVYDIDTLQPFSYEYNSRSYLTSINDLSNIATTLAGCGSDTLHFAQSMDFGDSDPSAHHNGRVSSIESSTSISGAVRNHGYQYSYNELGWMTNADHVVDTWRNCEYNYNALGMRMSKVENTVSSEYTYWPNSSKLAIYTGCNLGQFLHYDEVGNLLSDPKSGIYQIKFDYRDLMTESALDPSLYNGRLDTLYFKYDEAERRIVKRYAYQIQVDCDPPDPYEIEIGGGKSNTIKPGIDTKDQTELSQEESAGHEKKSCIKNVNTEIYYLYDMGKVVATFKKGDIVEEYYINGLPGRIATYRYNSDNHLYYHFMDHQQSERMAMSGRFSFDPSVVQSIDYNPFAKVVHSIGNYHPRYTYTDKEMDGESSFDLYCFGARFYNAETGQFVSTDKAGQYVSRYLFAGNNPTIGVDPNGYWFGIDDLIVAAVSFTVGYITHGIQTGEWGWEAVEAGGKAAAAAWLGYNTGGMIGGWTSTPGTGAHAMISSTVSAGVSTASSQVMNEQKIGGRQFWSSLAGGAAGSAWGFYLDSDPLSSAFIGGAVQGGISEGSIRGVVIGGHTGFASGLMTHYAYTAYGKILTNKKLGEGAYGTDAEGIEGNHDDLRRQLKENFGMTDAEIEVIIADAKENYSCHDFALDLENSGLPKGAKRVIFEGQSHSAIDLGGTPYGQRYMLSKHGQALIIRVDTGRQLSTGTWLNYNIPAGYENTPYSPVYGPWRNSSE